MGKYVKSIENTWFLANRREKRQLLELATSNMTVTGKKPSLTTKKWLDEATISNGVIYGGPHDDKYRSANDLGSLELQQAIDAFDCPEVAAFSELCDGIKSRTAGEDLPNIPNLTVYRDAA